MAKAILTISSKNYSSRALRAWLLCKMAGLEFEEEIVPPEDPSMRAELLLLSPSFLVPRLAHEGIVGMGYAGHWRVPQRTEAQSRIAACSTSGARTLPVGVRRDAFGVSKPMLGAADESSRPVPGLQGVGGGPS